MAGNVGGYLQTRGGGGAAGGTVNASGFVSGGAIQVIDPLWITAEAISGGRAVAFNQSGQLQIAMASVSGRMPAIGIARDNVLSGVSLIVYRGGPLFNGSGNQPFDFSGLCNNPVYVGASGHVVASGAPQASGNIQQLLGVTISQSGLEVQLGDPLESVILGSGDIGSGAITGAAQSGSMMIASGSIGGNDVGSGQITRYLMASGNLVEVWPCGQAMSGVRAVALGSGGDFVVPAERSSGLRLPAFGVSVSTAVSGGQVEVVTRGRVLLSGTQFSGTFASGFPGQWLYCGSGGLLINQSGFMGGTSSGHGAGPTAALSGYSGCLTQRLALYAPANGLIGFYVMPETTVTSGLISGLLSQY